MRNNVALRQSSVDNPVNDQCDEQRCVYAVVDIPTGVHSHFFFLILFLLVVKEIAVIVIGPVDTGDNVLVAAKRSAESP